MIRAQRRWHRLIWLLLAPLLIALVIWAAQGRQETALAPRDLEIESR